MIEYNPLLINIEEGEFNISLFQPFEEEIVKATLSKGYTPVQQVECTTLTELLVALTQFRKQIKAE